VAILTLSLAKRGSRRERVTVFEHLMGMKNKANKAVQSAAADQAASHDNAARWVAASLFILWSAISVGVAMAE
jgi:CHASE3 domain sensor protein